MGRSFATIFGALLAAALPLSPVQGQEFSALARLEVARSEITDTAEGVRMRLALSQPVPYKVGLMRDPPRVTLDFNEVDWAGTDLSSLAGGARRVRALRAGILKAGWSRLVIELDGPYAVARAGMSVADGSAAATIDLRLTPTSARAFAESARDSPTPAGGAAEPGGADDGTQPLRVVLDPGHGGVDPGAERDGVNEAELMLTFARELRDHLRRAGGFEVALTREDDSFVSLEGRIIAAREARADVFLSLHADALAEGRASGTTVYLLAEDATDEAAAALAERHDRDNLLEGVDLSAQGDTVAKVLMSMARTETTPRTESLAGILVETIGAETGHLHPDPVQGASFSVLKTPDVPSVLIELGFLSNPEDRKRLVDEEWRGRMAEAITNALAHWAREDATRARSRLR